jgi:hypothetical protein
VDFRTHGGAGEEAAVSASPLVRALRTLNESERKLAFILGFLLFVAGLLDLYWRTI